MKHTPFLLRPWRLSDVPSLAENMNNIQVWNNLRDLPFPYTEEDATRFINMVLAKPKPPTELAIVVGGKAVGGIGLIRNSNVERISAELGYWLGEKYWNQGIMTTAIVRMIAYASERFPLMKVYAMTFDFNVASQRVLQKAGFECEAVLRKGAIKNGRVVDLHYYSLFINRDSGNEQMQ